MLRGLTKAFAYSRMPKATFAFLHPGKALRWGAAFYVGKLVLDRFRQKRHRQDRTRRAGDPSSFVESQGTGVEQPFPGSPPTN